MGGRDVEMAVEIGDKRSSLMFHTLYPRTHCQYQYEPLLWVRIPACPCLNDPLYRYVYSCHVTLTLRALVVLFLL